MNLSVAEDFLRFLRPGVAEDLVEAAKGDKSALKIAGRLKWARNALYVGVALVVIGAVGIAMGGPPGLAFFVATLTLGAVVALVAAKIMHSQILNYRKI